METLPRSPDCLRYIFKVHLRVDRQNMAKVLRQLTVRPFVLLQLLYFLIEHNHEVFRKKGSMAELRQQMQAAVQRLYPVAESELHKPVEEQESHLPDDLVDLTQAKSSPGKSRLLTCSGCGRLLIGRARGSCCKGYVQTQKDVISLSLAR